MEFFWIFLVLALLVTVFGFGVVIANRRRAGTLDAPPARAPLPPVRPADRAPARGGVAVDEPPVAVEPEAPVVEEPPAPVRPASLRDRLAKARSAFSGAFTGVLGRSAITDETWDELEEALLRADVGLGVTEALLDDLKARVRSKEIVEPSAAARRAAGRHGRPSRGLRPHPPLRRVDGRRRARTCGCSSA